MLAAAYLVAALLQLILFRDHEPRGDDIGEPAPHSVLP